MAQDSRGSRGEIIERFAATLRELRLAAGNPSYAQLGKINAQLPRSTVSDALNAVSAPSIDLVMRFVDACQQFSQLRGHPLAAAQVEPAVWRSRWEAMRRSLDGSLADVTPNVPWQLPRVGGPLFGREKELALMDDILLGPASTFDGPLLVIEGPAGVGKTALALRWGHENLDRFPDGQLFIDLRGFSSGPPRDPVSVLGALLAALGAPVTAPVDVAAAAARFRSAVAGRRLLLVLDNAADPGQLRPLLPATPGVAVIVTSRAQLPGLAVADGAERIPLAPLALETAVEVLAAGRPVRDGLAALAETCGRLPLPLRIAAQRLAEQSVDDVSSSLLVPLDGNDEQTDLARVFSWSTDRLTAEASRLFRLLGLLPSGAVSLDAAAALLDGPSEDPLAELAQCHLAEETNAERFELHDLLRDFAREQARAVLTEAEAEAARHRWVRWNLVAADAADRVLLPQRGRGPVPADLEPPAFATYEAALAWCDTELPLLVEAVLAAEELGDHRLVCELAHALLGFFNIRKPWVEWVRVFRAAVAAAAIVDEPEVVGDASNGLGIALRERGDSADAASCFRRAAEEYRVAGDLVGLSMVLNNLGTLATAMGAPGEALEHYSEALQHLSELGQPWRTAIVVHNLAEAELALGHTVAAAGHADEALRLCRQLGDRSGEGAALTTIGHIHRVDGRLAKAIDSFTAAVDLQDSIGERQPAAISRHRLGLALQQAGRAPEAEQHLARALVDFEALGDPLAADVRADLASQGPQAGGMS